MSDRDLGRDPNEPQLGAKLKKAFKGGEKMFKSIVSAIPGMGAFADLLLSMADVTGILKPFEAVFNLLMGLFGIMGAQIIPVLMTAIRPLLGIMIEMTPVFIFLGKVIALVLSVALIPFIIGIELLHRVLVPFIPLFDALIPLIEAVSPLIEIVAEILVIFIDMIPITQVLVPLVGGMVDAINAASNAIATFVGWIQGIINIVSSLPGGGGGGGGGGGDEGLIPDWIPILGGL